MADKCSRAGGRLMLALQLAVMLVVMTARVEAQGQSILTWGSCRAYQSAATFDNAYMNKLTTSTDGYALLLTSDRPRTSNCQRLNFYPNGTFFFSYNDDYNRMQNHSDTYTFGQSNFNRPGYIQLQMPVALFGATLTGNLQLNVLLAEDDYLVVASCWEPVPLLRIEYIHVFVPAEKVDTLSPVDLQTAFIGMGVPKAEEMREVYQGCFASIRFLDTEDKADLYNFLVKIGLAPPLPIRRLHEVRSGVPRYFSGSHNYLSSQPTYRFEPSTVDSLQSMIYPPSTSMGRTSSKAGQEQTFAYNTAHAPSNSLSPDVLKFIPSGYFPVSSANANYNSQSFGYSSPAVRHGPSSPDQSSSGISYSSPVASYSPVSAANPHHAFSNHHPVVINYATPNFG